MEAEDEDNISIDKFARMAGAKFSGPLGGGGASWELGGEWTDTYAWELTTGDRQPAIVYRNLIYFDGFTYRDRPIRNSIDTDSELQRSEEHTSELQSIMRTSYAVSGMKTQHKKYRMHQDTTSSRTERTTK